MSWLCLCGCGLPVSPRSDYYADDNHRKRLFDRMKALHGKRGSREIELLRDERDVEITMAELEAANWQEPADSDDYQATCRHCGNWGPMAVVCDTPLRLWLRCRGCGAGQFQHGPRSGFNAHSAKLGPISSGRVDPSVVGERFRAGTSREQLAVELGISTFTVTRCLRSAGISREEAIRIRTKRADPAAQRESIARARRVSAEVRRARRREVLDDFAAYRAQHPRSTLREAAEALGVGYRTLTNALYRQRREAAA